MPSRATVRNTLLSAALAATLAVPLVQGVQATAAPAPTVPAVPAVPAAPAPAASAGPQGSPGSAALQPTTGTQPGDPAAAAVQADVTARSAACTPETFTSLSPTALADFLADRSHTYQDCLRPLLVNWSPLTAKVMTPEHVRAVAARVSSLAPSFDSANNLNQQELWYYLHIAVFFDFNHTEVDLSDDTTVAALDRAIRDYTANPRVFEPTTTNGSTMGELVQTGTAPKLRLARLPLVKRVLRTFAPGSPTVGDSGWNWAVQGALQLNFQGISNVGEDPQGLFRAAVAADADYREAFRAYAGYTHLKGTGSEWAAGDAMLEYGRFAQIGALKPELTQRLGSELELAAATFGRMTRPWANLVGPINDLGLCGPYAVCRTDLERQLFPNTYSYDNGTLVVRTALDKATADQLYYATKQVKAQFFRTLGTDQPLADDTHPALTVQLYDTKTNYQAFQNLLFGIGDVQNGGMFLEERSTFYTYQRTTQESYFSLEELFRHEYTHYLNARWAIPGSGYTTRWPGDATFAMNEGTAEYFAGSTRDGGVKARKYMVRQIGWDDQGGTPRLTVDEILHATQGALGFRAYPYAATFFNLLGEKHPDQLAEMYRLLRADDRAGYDAWRERLGHDAALQREYTAFLDAEIPLADNLYVPATGFTPNGQLTYSMATEVRSAFTAATQNTPDCKDNGDWNNKMRFTCTGRITANLTNSADAGQIRKDMAATVDTFLLDRGGAAANNLADMNCWFGKVDVWPSGGAGTADYSCEGPLRR
ncbi:collagenase [Streptomyces sp. NRRL WC-3742]|uniref:collagenase n=1 Tax=Streptomyces sp. NRRL WC-3742 TaxID=1463934 RepID=UPI0004CAF9E1|nr:collagenase [Streptomyces sp. NRRL WC-3742]